MDLLHSCLSPPGRGTGFVFNSRPSGDYGFTDEKCIMGASIIPSGPLLRKKGKEGGISGGKKNRGNMLQGAEALPPLPVLLSLPKNFLF